MSNSWKGLFFGLTFAASSAFSANYLPNQVIVKYKDDAVRTNTVMNSIYDRVGADQVKYFSGPFKNFEVLKLSPFVSAEDAIQTLNEDPNVEYAQPDYYLYIPEIREHLTATMDDGDGDDGDEDGGIGIPCLPGLEIPGCTPMPCLLPGFPPDCDPDAGFPGLPDLPEFPGFPGGPPAKRPVLEPPPAEVSPPVADPDLDKTWGLHKIKAPDAWAKYNEAKGTDSAGSKDIIVAVIDTGVDYNHPDLAFNIWRNPNPTKEDHVGWNFVHDDNLPYDDQSHGTHVSGTIGAVGNDGIAIAGVSQRVSIMALKFLSSTGMGQTSGAIGAIDYAIANGAKIMNNSWGSEGPSPDNKALEDAVGRAETAGVLFVAAAGNGGRDGKGDNNDIPAKAGYPASFDNEIILSVAASDQNDKITKFSNYGKKSVDVAAPGFEVYSSIPGGKYKAYSGTSMATPHTAGAAALVWAMNPDWTALQVKKALMDTVDPVASHAGKSVTGGRINVLSALDAEL